MTDLPDLDAFDLLDHPVLEETTLRPAYGDQESDREPKGPTGPRVKSKSTPDKQGQQGSADKLLIECALQKLARPGTNTDRAILDHLTARKFILASTVARLAQDFSGDPQTLIDRLNSRLAKCNGDIRLKSISDRDKPAWIAVQFCPPTASGPTGAPKRAASAEIPTATLAAGNPSNSKTIEELNIEIINLYRSEVALMVAGATNGNQRDEAGIRKIHASRQALLNTRRTMSISPDRRSVGPAISLKRLDTRHFSSIRELQLGLSEALLSSAAQGGGFVCHRDLVMLTNIHASLQVPAELTSVVADWASTAKAILDAHPTGRVSASNFDVLLDTWKVELPNRP